MNHIYLGAVAFGATLLVVSLVLGGKDTDHGDASGDHGADHGPDHGADHGPDHGPDHGGEAHGSFGDVGIAWFPLLSLRFWVFLFAFGGGAGLALTRLGSSATVAAIGALGIGWATGALAVTAIRSLTKHSVSSGLAAGELVGASGTLILPVGPGRPGKVRVDVKGRIEDYIATSVDDGGELMTGAAVLIIAEGERGSLVVAKAV